MRGRRAVVAVRNADLQVGTQSGTLWNAAILRMDGRCVWSAALQRRFETARFSGLGSGPRSPVLDAIKNFAREKLAYFVNAETPQAPIFMNDLQALSGPWSGFWIQSQLRGYMRLRLQFFATGVIGGGSDCAGWFEIRGRLASDGTVAFSKRYSSYVVEYEGRWDGNMISGLWTMRHPVLYGQGTYVEEKGEFEIWPESGESESVGEVARELQAPALTA